MTDKQSADLMNDFEFRGRIKVNVLKYAKYIHGESPSTDGHSPRYRWAQAAYQNPEQVTLQVHPPLVMDDQVQVDGADIEDSNLYMAVQRTVNQFM